MSERWGVYSLWITTIVWIGFVWGCEYGLAKWLNSETGAAYVQALFTVIAIAGSAAVVRWQVAKEHDLAVAQKRRETFAEEMLVITGFIAIAEDGLRSLKNAVNYVGEDPGTRAFFFLGWEEADTAAEVAEAMAMTDIGVIRGPTGKLAVLRIRKLYGIANAKLNSVRHRELSALHIKPSVDDLSRTCGAIEDSIRDLMELGLEVEESMGGPANPRWTNVVQSYYELMSAD